MHVILWLMNNKEMLSSQEVIGLFVGIGVIFVFLFSFRRFSGIKNDTRLHLKKKRTDSAERHILDPATLEESNGGLKMKSLNVLFIYNGHSFEAHEIFGIPPGSSMKTIEEAYQKLQATVQPDSREFVNTAYKVLKQEKNRSK